MARSRGTDEPQRPATPHGERPSEFRQSLLGPATPFRDDPQLVDDVVAVYRAGESGYSLAARYGVSDDTIYGLLRRAGVPRRTPSEAQRLRTDRAVAA